MNDVSNQLKPALVKARLAHVVRSIAWGLGAGAVLAAIALAAGHVLRAPQLASAGYLLLGAGAVAGAALAAWRMPDLKSVARAVDGHFDLSDRALSAVTFLEQGRTDGLYQLQIRDASRALARVQTAKAVRLAPFAPLVACCAAAAICGLLVALPPRASEISAPKSSTAAAPTPRARLPLLPNAAKPNVAWQAAANARTDWPNVPDSPRSDDKPGDSSTPHAWRPWYVGRHYTLDGKRQDRDFVPRRSP